MRKGSADWRRMLAIHDASFLSQNMTPPVEVP
jgi:hypothetical protein